MSDSKIEDLRGKETFFRKKLRNSLEDEEIFPIFAVQFDKL